MAIALSSIATESAFPTISLTFVKPETVMSAKMAMTTSSSQVTDTSSRKVYFFKESPAVLSTTTYSRGINIIKGPLNEFIKGYVDSKNYEHTSDDTSSTESEDAKSDGNNISENTRSSRNMAISTLDPDNMRTVDIDTGPTDSAHQVYQAKVSPVKSSDGQTRPNSSEGTSGSHRATGEHFKWRRTPKEASPSRFASQRFNDGSNEEKSSRTSSTAATSSATSSARSRPSAQFAQKVKYEKHAKPSSP